MLLLHYLFVIWWSLWSRFCNCYPFHRWWYELRIHTIIIVLICLFIYFFWIFKLLRSQTSDFWFPFRSFSFFSILVYFVCFYPVRFYLEPNCNLFHYFFFRVLKLWPVSICSADCNLALVYVLCTLYIILVCHFVWVCFFFQLLNKIIHYTQFWYVHSK